MVQIRLRTLYSSPNGSFAAGSVIDVPEAEADGLVSGGYAERLHAPSAREIAVTRPPEARSGIEPVADEDANGDTQDANADDDATDDDDSETARIRRVLDAVHGLDSDSDDDWTQAGLPSVRRVEEIAGVDTSRDEIERLAPGFCRAHHEPVRAAGIIECPADEIPVAIPRTNRP